MYVVQFPVRGTSMFCVFYGRDVHVSIQSPVRGTFAAVERFRRIRDVFIQSPVRGTLSRFINLTMVFRFYLVPRTGDIEKLNDRRLSDGVSIQSLARGTFLK